MEAIRALIRGPRRPSFHKYSSLASTLRARTFGRREAMPTDHVSIGRVLHCRDLGKGAIEHVEAQRVDGGDDRPHTHVKLASTIEERVLDVCLQIERSSSVVISGHQWSSVAISGHQWSSVISGPQCLTYACSVHDPSRGSERESHACIAASEPRSASPRSTSDMPTCKIREFIRGHPRPSEAIRGRSAPG